MNLETENLHQLYGDRIYIIPDDSDANPNSETKVQRSSPEALTEGKVTWKSKPGSSIFFILEKAEYENKALTGFLKKIVVATEVPLDKVGFGIIEGNPTLEQVLSFNGAIGIVFSQAFIQNKNPFQQDNKSLFSSFNLEELEPNTELKGALWAFLQTIRS